ncbi:MAG TPA: glycosyltransferase family 4 protein [Kofleriaceae bacterium]|nr:glycosyltransferase family 4 protein [Kofleriaceae bacterium]
MRHVIRALTPMHSVDLLVVRENEQAYVERQGSVRVLRVPTHEADPRSQIQAFQRALKRQLDGADYDVVHCRDPWSGIPVLEARQRLGYAVVYDLTRSPLGETTGDPELDAQYARDEEACLLAADMVLAPTHTAVKTLQGRGKPGSDRIVFAPPGVDVDRFDWDHQPKGGIPRIVYVGSIDPGRGLRVLVRAMAAIVRETDARLVLAGAFAPKFEQSLVNGIHELGLHDKVELLGPVDHDQLPALIATATVCIVPAAADLANPTALYPTKLLEYMACKRPIVAPRRETVQLVLENNREALLFEPGDPLDLARKVMRLLGEPLLRDRIALNAYERVRRDFTASAARRALRAAYNVLADRFQIEAEPVEDEAPKIDVLADDDFEATVFEEPPAAPSVDTGLNLNRGVLDDALASLEHTGSSAAVIAPAVEPDETMERAPVEPAPRDPENWTASGLAAPPAPSGHDDWVVTNVATAVRGLSVLDDANDVDVDIDIDIHHDDGTPIEGVIAAAPPLPIVEASFVAGEIDVPPPAPERDHDTPAVEFHGPGVVEERPRRNGRATEDPDTGSRTPPLERR